MGHEWPPNSGREVPAHKVLGVEENELHDAEKINRAVERLHEEHGEDEDALATIQKAVAEIRERQSLSAVDHASTHVAVTPNFEHHPVTPLEGGSNHDSETVHRGVRERTPTRNTAGHAHGNAHSNHASHEHGTHEGGHGHHGHGGFNWFAGIFGYLWYHIKDFVKTKIIGGGGKSSSSGHGGGHH